jgi:hypothetical protein
MRTKTATYLLILLSLFTQVDDGLLAIASLPPPQAASDDDEFLVPRRDEGEQRAPRHEPTPTAGLIPAAGTSLPGASATTAPSGSSLSGPPRPSPLYLFMSLRC